MALDMQAIEKFNLKLDNIESLLSENRDLFNNDSFVDFKSERQDLINKVNICQQEGRTLQIGIIGAVKAGKSSFLNALLFDGEEILPKAATPMTAALTKISYGEEPEAKIYFYSQDDWMTIKELSNEYDSRLDKEYERYAAEIKKQCAEIDRYNLAKRDFPKEPPKQKPVLLEKSEYEKKLFRKLPDIGENMKAAKELTNMAEGTDVFEKLGTSVTISSDDLNDYIGAKGKYTPAVNYVELKICDKRLEDIIIVDTPGLNDPIISRGNVTKKFLSNCDVALLLSPTSQFMDENTMQLMISSLPSAGVNEILIVGSKLDSGILDYYKKDASIKEAAQSSVSDYNAQLQQNILSLKSANPEMARKLSGIKPVYVSSLMHSIMTKKRNDQTLSEEESHILKIYHERFADFDDSAIKQLSGINNVKVQLQGVIKRKEAIINSKNDEILKIARHRFVGLLNQLGENVRSSKTKLRDSDIDNLNIRYGTLNDVLEKSRMQLASVFESAANQAEKSSKHTEAHLETELANFTNIRIKSDSHDENRERRSGFLGIMRENYTVTVTDYIAETSDVVNNIHKYIGTSKSIIDNDFNHLVNTDSLKRNVKEVVINAMHTSGGTYTEDDVLMPLNATLTKITISEISINADEYIDHVNTAFKSGVAKGDDIHTLNLMQSRIMSFIFSDLKIELTNSVKQIRDTLMKQSDTFTDTIINKLNEEFNRLRSQMEQKEAFVARYDEFLNALTILRQQLSE